MRLAHQATILFWGRLSSQLVLLARAMILSRLMPKDQYGSYGQAVMIGTLITPYLVMGLQNSVPFFFARLTAERQKGLVITLTTYLLVAGTLAGCVLFASSGLVAAWWGNPDLERLLRFFALVVVFLELPQIVAPALLSKQRPVLSGLYLPAVEIPGVALVVATYALTRSVEAMFLAMAALRLAQCIAGAYLMIRVPFRGVRAGIDRGTLRQVLRYSLPLGLAAIVGQTTLTIDRILISWKFGPEDFAVYRNGAFELPFVTLITSAIFTVLLPEMSRMAHGGQGRAALELWKEGVRRCAMLAVPGTVFAVVFASDLTILLWSREYLGSVPIFQLYTASLLIRVALYGNVFVAFNRPELIFRLALLTLVVNTVGGIVLIELLGFLGPALAAFFSRYFRALITIAAIARVTQVGFSEAMPWAALGRLLLCAGLATAAAFPLTAWDTWPLLRVGVAAGVTGTAFALLAWLTGTIRGSDLEFVTSAIRRRRR